MKTPEDEAFEEIERIQRTRTRWGAPVQVSIDEFLMRIKFNPDEKGNPIIWTQWPVKEDTWDCDEEILRLVNSAIEAEREACAKVCEETDDGTPYNLAEECARNIRARGEA
jgi:hypothetical protein